MTNAAHATHGRYDFVVFDLGNVLIAWDPAPAVAAGVGESAAREFLTNEEFDFAEWNREQDAGRSWAEALELLGRTHPRLLPAGQSYVEHFGASLTGEVEGTRGVLDDLAALGRLRLAALTNWSAELFPHARARFELLDQFEDIIVSGEVGLAKPDPRIFQLVGERLAVPLSRCVFIDDSLPNVAAARDAGMTALHFTGSAALRTELVELGFPLR